MRHLVMGMLTAAVVAVGVVVLKPELPVAATWGPQEAPIKGHCGLNDSIFYGATQGASPCGAPLKELVKQMR